MPRNGSGTASIVNTFTPLTTAVAEDVNENFTDIATMITDSLPRDGQAGMSGQFLATSGTVTEPGISFNADPNTGIRRPNGDEVAVVCGGADVATFTASGATITGPVYASAAPTEDEHLTNKEYVDGLIPAASSLVPTGSVALFASSTVPSGWLECDGAAVSRTTYAALFAVIGTTWGSGDASTTFNLPDLRGEFVRGWDHGKGTDSGRAFASSQSDANKAHTHTVEKGGEGGGNFVQNGPSTGGTITTSSSGGTEARPRNIALMYIIKT